MNMIIQVVATNNTETDNAIAIPTNKFDVGFPKREHENIRYIRVGIAEMATHLVLHLMLDRVTKLNLAVLTVVCLGKFFRLV